MPGATGAGCAGPAAAPRAALLALLLAACACSLATGNSNEGITVLVDENQQANLTTTTNANVTSQSSVFFGLTDSTHVHDADDIDAAGRTADDADLTGQPVWLDGEDPEARCLDGSPGFLHFSRGSSANRGWLIHHTGGGWCTSIADCCRRAVTSLGSSRSYTAASTIDMRMIPLGYLSRSNVTNPHMKDYNIVILHYCDGASFSGNLEQPIRGVCKGLGQVRSCPPPLHARTTTPDRAAAAAAALGPDGRRARRSRRASTATASASCRRPSRTW